MCLSQQQIVSVNALDYPPSCNQHVCYNNRTKTGYGHCTLDEPRNKPSQKDSYATV